VVDYFELLHEPRRPWLDSELLKNKFLSLSSELHPDRVHGASTEEKDEARRAFTELNTAYQTLRQPKDRLAHLLELSSGAKPKAIQRAPEELMELFMQVGTVCREVDQFLEQKRKLASPLLQVALFEQGQQLIERLNGLQTIIRERTNAAEQALQRLSKGWEQTGAAETLFLDQLEQSYRCFSYLGRWSAQLNERVVQLAM
jgi:DnaJ-domain-containing protein 1